MAEVNVPITAGTGTPIATVLDASSNNRQIVAIGAGDGTANLSKIDVNGAQRVYQADPNSTNVSKWSAKQYPYVELDPISDFYDGFDKTLDTTNAWTTGGTAPTAITGSLTFNAGTAANAASYLRTKPSFVINAGVVNRGGALVTLAAAAETGSKAWWGYGIPAAAPTMALPFSNAVVFEIKDTDGSLVGAVYSNGVRTTEVALVIPAQLAAPVLATGRPSDGALHRYAVNYRSSKVWFEIDDVLVGSITTPNTSVVNLPWSAGVINGASILGAARTITISTASSGDTGRNSLKLSDGVFSWRKGKIDIQGAQKIGQGLPAIIQQASATSTGSVGSLTATFPNINDDGNTIVVSVGVGNGTQPTVTDSNGNTYKLGSNVANGTAFNVSIFYASNISNAAVDTITVTNGGTTASIAVEIYEFEGLLLQGTAVVDTSASATGTSTTPSTAAISPFGPNEFVISAIGVGTAAQTITPAAGWTNDSGQLNPTTPAGLFSFASISQFAGSVSSLTPSATITSEPWAMVAVAFRPPFMAVEGVFRQTDGTTTVGVVAATQAAKVDTTSIAGTATAVGKGISGTGVQRVVNAQETTFRASTIIPLVTAVTVNVPFFNIIGSATKTVTVKRITVSGLTQTAVGYFPINVEKLSTASTSGTSTTLVATALDTNNAAVTAVVKAYTVAPTKGTLVGTLRSWRALWQSTTAVAGGPTVSYDFTFGDTDGSTGVVLRGVAQELALTFPVVLASAGTLSVDIEWTEE